jgi:hypothetical protein
MIEAMLIQNLLHRVEALEKDSHPKYDFTELVEKVERLDKMSDVKASDKCCGVIGWLCGHRFVSRLLKETPPQIVPGMKLEGTGKANSMLVEALTLREYIVCCKRCGRESEQEVK